MTMGLLIVPMRVNWFVVDIQKLIKHLRGKLLQRTKNLDCLTIKVLMARLLRGNIQTANKVLKKLIEDYKKNTLEYFAKNGFPANLLPLRLEYDGVLFVFQVQYLIDVIDVVIFEKPNNVSFYLSKEDMKPSYIVCGSAEILLMPMDSANDKRLELFNLENAIDKITTKYVKAEETKIEETKKNLSTKDVIMPFLQNFPKYDDSSNKICYLVAKSDKNFFVSNGYYLIELPNDETNKEILEYAEKYKVENDRIGYNAFEKLITSVKNLKSFYIDDFLNKYREFFNALKEETKVLAIKKFNQDIVKYNFVADVDNSGIDKNNYNDIIKYAERFKTLKRGLPVPKLGEYVVENNGFFEIKQGQVLLKIEDKELLFPTKNSFREYGIGNIVFLFKKLGYDEILCGIDDKNVLFSTKDGYLKILFSSMVNNGDKKSQFPYTIKGDVVTQENISNEKELFDMLKTALEKNNIPVSFANEEETRQQLKREGSNDEDIEFSITETSESDDLEEDIAESYQTSMPFDYNEETNELKQKIVSLEAENEKLKMLAQKVCELKETYGLSTISADDRKELLKMLKNC
jgi:hypothetical protein